MDVATWGVALASSEVLTFGRLLAWLAAIVLIIASVLGVMLYSVWLERKLIGRIQDRYGPNRVGKFGLLQPFADMIKILIKEDITPAGAHRTIFNLGAALMVPPAFLAFAVIPVSAGLVGTDLSVALLYCVAMSSASVIPIFMAGWGSRNKYALLGAMRAVAQIVAYEIPQVLSLVGVVLLAGSLSLQSITYSQGPLQATGQPTFPGVWFVLLQPVGFMIFLIATAAEVERSPFDIPEAESEIVAGYHIEYSGIKFGMFYVAQYVTTLATCALGAILFLGGWQPPLSALAFIPGPIWLGLKTYGLVLVFMWLRGTLPRLRIDQLLAFAWKVLVPLALANLLIAGLVGKLAHDSTRLAAAGTIQASPLLTVVGFTLANVCLVALALGLALANRRPTAPTADSPLAEAAS